MNNATTKNRGSYGTVIAVILFFAMVIGNYFQYQLSPLAGQLMTGMGLTSNQFSSVFTSPMISAIILGIIAGVLVDKFGSKRVITIALIISAAALCCRPFADSYATLFASMLLGGTGVTFLNVNLSKIVGGWYPPEKVGSMMGFIMAGSTVGMTLGIATTAMLPSIPIAFWISGIGFVAVVVLWLFFVKEGPYSNAGNQAGGESLLTSLKVVLRSKNIWLVGLCLAFVLGCNIALASFLPTALQSRGFSESAAGLLSSVMTVGSFCGSFFGPAVITRVPRMKPALIFCAVIAAFCAVFGWMTPSALAAVLLFLAGTFISALVPTFMAFPMLLPEIGPAYAGTGGGVISTLELLGAVIIPTYVITPLAGGNFKLYFIMAGISIAIMAIIALFLPELNRKKIK